jgi:hypothetical protein
MATESAAAQSALGGPYGGSGAMGDGGGAVVGPTEGPGAAEQQRSLVPWHDLAASATSEEVFWLSRPPRPTVVGMGRNVLCSWEPPSVSAAWAGAILAPRPVWTVHVTPLAGGKEAAASTVVVGQTWAVVAGLTTEADFEVSLSVELPVGFSNRGDAAAYSTRLAAPTAALRLGASPPVVRVALPPPTDPLGHLAALAVQSRSEALVGGRWEPLHNGPERLLDLHGLPRDVFCLVRARISLDLRSCRRLGAGIRLHPQLPSPRHPGHHA